MKKILFTILAVAAMAAACTKFEQETTPDFDTVTKPEVTATVVSDSSITVTVTAAAGTHYWGYAVMTGAPGAAADKLVAGGYAKDPAVVLQGAEGTPQAAYVKYTEETSSITLELKDLTPYTDYTVYAAAVSVMGVTSEVAEITVKTTDGIEPTISAFDFSEADEVLTFAISFNDPVELTGNGTAKAWFYGENYYDKTGMLVLYKEVDIPATHIAASGKNLLVAVPEAEYIPGAYVAITYSAGIVKNGAGAVNAAYETHVIGYDEKGAIQKKGIFGYYDYANWEFSLVDPATLPDEEEGEGEMEDDEEEEEKVPVYFQDWTSLVMKTYATTKYGIKTDTEATNIRVTVTHMDGKTISYDAAADKFAAIGDNVLGLMLNEDPSFGGSISYTIAEGSFADLFGNVNAEFTAEDEYYCSYGYTLEDIVGEWTVTGMNLFTGATVTYPLVIEEAEEPEDGNIVITNYFGFESEYQTDFNVHAGYFTVGEYYYLSSAETHFTFFNNAGDQKFAFAPGKITCDAYVCVMSAATNNFDVDADGNKMAFAGMVATKVK